MVEQCMLLHHRVLLLSRRLRAKLAVLLGRENERDGRGGQRRGGH
jgi:hypothetical protein